MQIELTEEEISGLIRTCEWAIDMLEESIHWLADQQSAKKDIEHYRSILNKLKGE